MITITDILDCELLLDDVDGVVFDLDDTLYNEREYVRSGYQAVAAVIPQVEHLAEKLWAAFEQHLPAIDAVLQSEGLDAPELKERALEAYRAHQPDINLRPEVRALLMRLKMNKKLGLITDGRPQGQRAKILALGLEPLLDAAIITDELGGVEFRKPNPEAFVRMSRALDVPFRKMVYIGDNMKKDFIAPGMLGMQVIYYKNPDGLYTG